MQNIHITPDHLIDLKSKQGKWQGYIQARISHSRPNIGFSFRIYANKEMDLNWDLVSRNSAFFKKCTDPLPVSFQKINKHIAYTSDFIRLSRFLIFQCSK